MFVGDNSQGVAGWKLVMMAVSILLYQNLDNLDGKQARRTSTLKTMKIPVRRWGCCSTTAQTQSLPSTSQCK